MLEFTLTQVATKLAPDNNSDVSLIPFRYNLFALVRRGCGLGMRLW